MPQGGRSEQCVQSKRTTSLGPARTARIEITNRWNHWDHGKRQVGVHVFYWQHAVQSVSTCNWNTKLPCKGYFARRSEWFLHVRPAGGRSSERRETVNMFRTPGRTMPSKGSCAVQVTDGKLQDRYPVQCCSLTPRVVHKLWGGEMWQKTFVGALWSNTVSEHRQFSLVSRRFRG